MNPRKRILQSVSLCIVICLLLLSTLHVRTSSGSTVAERELARKLIKLFLAAAVLSPPGLGVFPFPLPLPVPFGIETLKPPIYAPFGFPFLHGGGFGGGLGGMGMGVPHLAAAASELQPTVIALPVVRPGSAAATNAITKIPVTLPKVNSFNANSFMIQGPPMFTSSGNNNMNYNPATNNNNNHQQQYNPVAAILSNYNNYHNNHHQQQAIPIGLPFPLGHHTFAFPSSAASSASLVYATTPSTTTSTSSTTTNMYSFLNPTPNPITSISHPLTHPYTFLIRTHKKKK